MKKTIITVATFALIGLSNKAEAQTKSPDKVNSDNYYKLKKEGKLTGKEQLYNTTDGTTSLLVSHPANEGVRTNNASHVMSSTGCNCWIPRDTSFHAVPFSGYTAPNYSNDDGSTAGITLPFNFCLYGTTVGGAGNQMYINNNGNISFGASYSTFSSVSFPTTTYTMIAPFWGDVDSNTPTTSGGVVWYKLTPTYLIVQWDSVGVFDHTGQVNTFQLIITNGTDSILPAGNNISFCYGEMQWTTGDASGGVGGFDGTPAYPATVGINKGDGTTFTQIGQFGIPGNTYAGSTGISGIGWLAGQSFYFNSCGTSGNLPPLVTSGGPSSVCSGDVMTICAIGDTLSHTVSFIPPSTTGSVSATATSPSLGSNFSVVSSTSGASASLTFQVNTTGLAAGYYTVTVTATNEVPLSTTLNYVIHILGIPNPTVTVNSATVCAGIPAVLTATGASIYTWNTGATTAAISPSPTVTTNYTVTGIDANSCTATATSTVVVNPLPIVTVNSPTTCVGVATTLTATGASTYTWNTGATTATISPSPTVSTYYTVIGTSANSCTATATSTVTTFPMLNVNSTTICGGGTATLTATGATTYSWNTGATTASISPSPTVTTDYTVTGVMSGCTASATSTVMVTSSPTVTVNSANICAGATATLTASGATTYTWNTGATTDTTIVSPTTSTNYTVTATTSGCIGSDSATTMVTVHTPQTPAICLVSTDSASNYKYNVIYWEKLYPYVDSFIVYRLNNSTGLYMRIGAVSQDSLSEFVDTAFSIGGPNGGNPQTGSWKYALAISDSCGNIGTQSPYHQTVFMTESGSTFSWTPYVDNGNSSFPTGYSFLRDDINNGIWTLLIANTPSTTATDASYASYPNANWRADALGFNCNPTLRLSGNNSTDAAKIKAHSNINNNRSSGINKLAGSNEISIYPNPAKDVLNIEGLMANTNSTLIITDMLGNSVKQFKIQNSQFTIDISDLSEGIFNISITTNEGVLNKRLVIVR
ncbi:MAG: nidogen-like domain-containing protein [Bacteroidia bacterium]